ncbi:MAG: GxxExxY protein [Thermodesulfobacteriota bacterium]
MDEKVIVQLQANDESSPHDERQILSRLRATGIKVGLIINFGKNGCNPRRFVS